jgi:hypothetical protein
MDGFGVRTPFKVNEHSFEAATSCALATASLISGSGKDAARFD